MATKDSRILIQGPRLAFKGPRVHTQGPRVRIQGPKLATQSHQEVIQVLAQVVFLSKISQRTIIQVGLEGLRGCQHHLPH